MDEVITRREYLMNKRLLDLVETTNLLIGPFRKAFYLKRNLLRDLGFKTILYNGRDIPLNDVSFRVPVDTSLNCDKYDETIGK